MTQQRVISVAILAMGGEGGGVLADWIVDVAEHAGWLAQVTSAPGVAQRTGATIYYIEMFPETPGRQPVFALMPTAGDVDVVIASELMEAARGAQRGFVTPDRTVLVASTNRVFSILEKTAIADAQVPSEDLLDICRRSARRLVAADMAEMAERAKSVISASLLGALAGCGALPFPPEAFAEAIRRGGIGVDPSLKAFEAGLTVAAGTPAVAEPPPASPVPADLGPLLAEAERSFPPESQAVLAEALARLVDFQDGKYASEFLARLAAIRDADAAHGDGGWRLLTETARYLALNLAYEDVIRVAELKLRRNRFARIAAEVRAAPGEIVRVREYLRPRLQEIADMLPEALGRRLLDSPLASAIVARLTRSGRILPTNSLWGFLLFYGLAKMKPLRRIGLRHALVQEEASQWLAAVREIAAKNYPLACELVECRNIVKGYGTLQELGRRNYERIIAEAQASVGRADAAGRIEALRLAAYEDDEGAAFNRLFATFATE